jgi:glycosyltransferase involved in cell wall biosynthesis
MMRTIHTTEDVLRALRGSVVNAWHSSFVARHLRPFIDDSRVCRAIGRAAAAIGLATDAGWRWASQTATLAARHETGELTWGNVSELSQVLGSGMIGGGIKAVASGWHRGRGDSRVGRFVTRWNDDLANAAPAAVVAATGVCWLVATVVHAALVTVQHGLAGWMAWSASAALALAAIAGRHALASAWTSACSTPVGGEQRQIGLRPDATFPAVRTNRARVLVVTPFPEEGAGYRFRIGQYIPYLTRAGFDVTVAPFFTTDFFRIVYRPGNYLRKLAFFGVKVPRRLGLIAARRRYDLIFIYREALPLGPPLIETALAWPGGPALVYDFDDAVFVGDTSEANRLFAFLKQPAKVRAIVRASTGVIAGNEYLGDYARRFNGAVTVIPTCVDTTVFAPRATLRRPADPIVVGWIGSPTTVRYLLECADVLAEIAQRIPFVLRIAGAGRPIEMSGVTVENAAWSLDREVTLFNTCDAGIYPLTDDAWTRGKCGFKAIQFMACGVPVVASAVGVNCEIVQDGVNGFLARTKAEWADRLTRLLSDAGLRSRFARAGRQRVEDRYSLQRHAPAMIAVLERALAREQTSVAR